MSPPSDEALGRDRDEGQPETGLSREELVSRLRAVEEERDELREKVLADERDWVPRQQYLAVVRGFEAERGREREDCERAERRASYWLEHYEERKHRVGELVAERDREREAREREQSYLRLLLDLILRDMPRATNRDLACDGPVGDEEEKVWALIEGAARRAKAAFSPPDVTES